MKNNKLLSIFITIIVFLITTAVAFSMEVTSRDEFQKVFPGFSFEEFRESPVKGLYEIVAGGQIFYFHPEGYLIFGEIYSKDGINITAERRVELQRKKISSLPLEKALRIGNGRHTVIEFSDPDCPFCRKAAEFFAKRADITRYIFFFPLTEIHPEAQGKAKHILCASEPEKAYKEVFSGLLDGKKIKLSPDCDSKASRILDEHISIARSLGIRGTPEFWVNGKQVSGANIPLIEKFLSDVK